MARDARLRLAENRDHFADGQFRLGEQRQKTQARLFAGGVERGERRLKSEPEEKASNARDIKISIYVM